MKKYQLMAPGPTPVPSEVLLAMAQPIIHHRTPEYEALFIEVRAGLKRLFQTVQDVIPLACSGTGRHGGGRRQHALGRRHGRSSCGRASSASAGLDLCRAFGVTVVELTAPFGETVPARARGRGAAAAPGRQGRARCSTASPPPACCTTCGLRRRHARHRRHPRRRRRLEPRHRRSPDGRVGRGRGRGRLAEGPDAAARARLLRAEREGVGQEQDRPGCRSYYLDLAEERKTLAKNEAHFTPAVSIVVGLREVSRCSRREGLANVFKRHDRLARATRAGVEALGLELFCQGHAEPGGDRGHGAGRREQRADRQGYSQRHNITIAGGQGEMKGSVFRLGHMGYAAEFDVITALVGARAGAGRARAAGGLRRRRARRAEGLRREVMKRVLVTDGLDSVGVDALRKHGLEVDVAGSAGRACARRPPRGVRRADRPQRHQGHAGPRWRTPASWRSSAAPAPASTPSTSPPPPSAASSS